MQFLLDKKFLWFVAKFLGLFAILYLGTLAVIGLAAPGGYYVPFVAEHLDFVSGLKNWIMWGVGHLVGMFGYETITEPGFLIRIINKRGVIIAMDCVGYGVYSFWIAYILANSGSWKKKFLWVTGGLLMLWMINLIRISLFLVVINKNQQMPLGINHHTWFNIVAYGFIFIMIYYFNKSTTINKNVIN